MNTTTITNRLTAAACAGLLAVTFAGCGNGADTAANTGSVVQQQPAIRFVPDDLDPRGRHVIREAVSGTALHDLLGREAAERYVAEMLAWARISARAPATVVDDVLSPLTGLSRAELRERYAPRAGTTGIDVPWTGYTDTGSARIDPRLTTAG